MSGGLSKVMDIQARLDRITLSVKLKIAAIKRMKEVNEAFMKKLDRIKNRKEM